MVLLGYHEEVSASHRMDVEESESATVFVYDVCGNLAFDNAAKNTIIHSTSMPTHTPYASLSLLVMVSPVPVSFVYVTTKYIHTHSTDKMYSYIVY